MRFFQGFERPVELVGADEYRRLQQERLCQANTIASRPQGDDRLFAFDDSRRWVRRHADAIAVPHVGGRLQLGTGFPSESSAAASHRAPSEKSLLMNHNQAIPEAMESAASASPVARCQSSAAFRLPNSGVRRSCHAGADGTSETFVGIRGHPAVVGSMSGANGVGLARLVESIPAVLPQRLQLR